MLVDDVAAYHILEKSEDLTRNAIRSSVKERFDRTVSYATINAVLAGKIKNCDNCDAEFYPARAEQKYCNAGCVGQGKSKESERRRPDPDGGTVIQQALCRRWR